MKKLLYILPVIVFLVSGCSFIAPKIISQNQVNQDLPNNANSESLTSNLTQTIALRTVKWDGKVYNFAHLCAGEKKRFTTSLFGSLGISSEQEYFCLGKNSLIYNESKIDKIIESGNIQNPAEAPILIEAKLIPSNSDRGIVLISYMPEPCATTGDCGVGGPTNFISHTFNLATLISKRINNFPRISDPVWNPEGSKALFLPYTCGGVGCGKGSILGYDVDQDQVMYQSSELGSEEFFEGAPGNPIPYWKRLSWLDNSNAIAELVSSDGKVKKIKINF